MHDNSDYKQHGVLPLIFYFNFFYLAPVAVKNGKYGRVGPVGEVCEHLEAVLHVVSAALDGEHGHIMVLEAPSLGELTVHHVQAAAVHVLHHHHLGHFALDHLDSVPAGPDNGLHFIRVEEVAPKGQADAQQEQGLRPEQEITHDATQKRQQRHRVSYHHTADCSLITHTSNHFHDQEPKSACRAEDLRTSDPLLSFLCPWK